MKQKKLSNADFFSCLDGLIKDATTEQFVLIETSTDVKLITTTAEYKTLLCPYTHPFILKFIKDAHKEIVQHLTTAAPTNAKFNSFFFSELTEEEKLQNLCEFGHLPPLHTEVKTQYTGTKQKFSQVEQLVEIDIKSAYIECAYKLNLIPQSLYNNIQNLPNFLLSQNIVATEEEAKDIAKKIRLWLLGGLAKKETTTIYNLNDTGDYEKDTNTERRKGNIIANVYFYTAKVLTDICKNILECVDDACFFWVDAIFCKANAVQEVCTMIEKAGYLYKVEEPRNAVFQFDTWFVGDFNTPIKDRKPYFFQKKDIFVSVLERLESVLLNCNGDFFAIKRALKFANTQQLFEKALKKLRRLGINANEFLKAAFLLKNANGNEIAIYQYIDSINLDAVLAEVENLNFWEELDDTNQDPNKCTWVLKEKKMMFV